VDDSSAIAAALDHAVPESDGPAALGGDLCPHRRDDLLGEPGQLTGCSAQNMKVSNP